MHRCCHLAACYDIAAAYPLYPDSVAWLQAEQAIKHLELEQQKAKQDQVKWEQQEHEMQQRLEQTLHTSQCLHKAKAGLEHEHSNLQELHRQLMTELQQRTSQVRCLQCCLSLYSPVSNEAAVRAREFICRRILTHPDVLEWHREISVATERHLASVSCCNQGCGYMKSMTVWQEPMLSLQTSRSTQLDLEGQLEASHAEVAHMREQIAAATAAVANARGSPIPKKHYPALGDADYSEDSLIRYVWTCALTAYLYVRVRCAARMKPVVPVLALLRCVVSSFKQRGTLATNHVQATDRRDEFGVRAAQD